MRKLIYYVAMSVDGFIAHGNGEIEGFLMEGPHSDDFFIALKQFDTVLMGKKTYQFGFKYGLKAGEVAYQGLHHFIFSKEKMCENSNQLEVIGSGIQMHVEQLKHKTGKDIWLCGGGKLAGFLFEKQLIDEVILKVNPIVFGSGVKLFECADCNVALNLLENKVYENNVILSHYSIEYGKE